MMELVLPRSWKEEFERAVALRREDILYDTKMKRFEIREREKQDERHIEEERREHEEIVAFEAAMASQEDIIEYQHQLVDYHTATVEALMDKQEILDRLRASMNKMEAQAQVLPDGRKVFKTQDGQRVVDENGQEISPDIIRAADIDDRKTKWEPYKQVKDEMARVFEERRQIIDYQVKLDDAGERLDKDGITNGELKDLKADLAKDMPDAVRAKLGLEKPEGREPVAEQKADQKAAATAALPGNMDNLVRQIGIAPP